MNKEVEITISEMQLNGTTAIRIMKCLKEHEPEIWHELKETIKQKLPIPDVIVPFYCGEQEEGRQICDSQCMGCDGLERKGR
jgi:hypothetical protein